MEKNQKIKETGKRGRIRPSEKHHVKKGSKGHLKMAELEQLGHLEKFKLIYRPRLDWMKTSLWREKRGNKKCTKLTWWKKKIN